MPQENSSFGEEMRCGYHSLGNFTASELIIVDI